MRGHEDVRVRPALPYDECSIDPVVPVDAFLRLRLRPPDGDVARRDAAHRDVEARVHEPRLVQERPRFVYSVVVSRVFAFARAFFAFLR